ncbi:MAG: DoxX family protein [Phycisphaerales bacterium]|nr:DoxX family protein [Phycisphaerales bacterium]MCI0631317.1 DoxX family protein [Phycisphaerales bacterium]MCI0677057.1 DoxX family protein [Phycisphaerales bacterium]
MSFSVTAATSFVPTLSRIVLCLAFVSAGYNKVFKESEFTDLEANRLQSLGVKTTAPVTVTSWADPSLGPASLIYASYRQEAEQDPPDVTDDQNQDPEPQTQPEPEPEVKPEPKPEAKPAPPATAPRRVIRRPPPTTTPATRPDPVPTPAPAPEVQPEAPAKQPIIIKPSKSEDEVPPFAGPTPVQVTSGGSHRAPGMYRIALMVDSAGWPAPVRVAQVAAFTELIGGALLLVGLFSRIWGLGLAISMGVAFYMVSVQMNGALRTHPFEFAEDVNAFHAMYCQLGLFVLAFGIFLTGPGKMSLDQLLFGGRRQIVVDDTMM